MKYRLLGPTGLYVSELCLGTMTFGNQGFWSIMGGLQQKDVNLLVQTAYDEGINFIDTANVYSFGESESFLGQAIKDTRIPRDQMIIQQNQPGLWMKHQMVVGNQDSIFSMK